MSDENRWYSSIKIVIMKGMVNLAKSEQVLGVMLKSGGKAEQQIAPEAREAFPSHPLMSLSTESVHDPVLGPSMSMLVNWLTPSALHLTCSHPGLEIRINQALAP